MIGCIADPVALARNLLRLLRPGGKLMFNAPDRDALHLGCQVWLDSAHPPDVVTLFPPGFFKCKFGLLAEVLEEVEALRVQQASTIALRQLLGIRWKKPQPKRIEAVGDGGLVWHLPSNGTLRLFARSASLVARIAELAALFPIRPAEFGLFVTLVRR
jgi:SAM-dependent methyltransferase